MIKAYVPIFISILALGFFSCNTQIDTQTDHQQPFNCNALTDKKFILTIAKSILEKDSNDQIWNLSDIDTIDFFTTEDYFTHPKTKNRLVLIGGSAGMSSGTADNLLMLFSCSDTFNILWSGQVGDFSQADIIDINNDGIKELVVKASTIWMGECNESYNIFNFKDGQQHFIYTAHSRSVIDCGLDNLAELVTKGDTLENTFDYSLIKLKEKEYWLKQIRRTKIHNGGKTDEEIIQKLTIV